MEYIDQVNTDIMRKRSFRQTGMSVPPIIYYLPPTTYLVVARFIESKWTQ